MNMKTCVVLFIFCYSIIAVDAFRQQAIAVSGKLMCGNQPAGNVRIKLWDEDDGIDVDDLLDDGYTASDGTFRLEGTEKELTSIDPVFKVYHDCNDGIKPGQRKVKFRLPQSYIANGSKAVKVFDIGTINLETIFMDEERELITS